MTNARLLLVVPDDSDITREARTERRALYQAVADKIGAELLVAGFGTPQLIEVPPLTEVVPVDGVSAAGMVLSGDSTIRYSQKIMDSFRFVESLLDEGNVKLVRDKWSRGALRFVSPSSTQPSALTVEPGVPTERVGVRSPWPSPLFRGVLLGVALAGVFGTALHWAGF